MADSVNAAVNRVDLERGIVNSQSSGFLFRGMIPRSVSPTSLVIPYVGDVGYGLRSLELTCSYCSRFCRSFLST